MRSASGERCFEVFQLSLSVRKTCVLSERGVFLKGEGSSCVSYVLMWLNLRLVFVTAVTSHPPCPSSKPDPANGASPRAADLLLGGLRTNPLGWKRVAVHQQGWKPILQGSVLSFLNFGPFHFSPLSRWWLLLGGKKEAPRSEPRIPRRSQLAQSVKLSWGLPWSLELCLEVVGCPLRPPASRHRVLQLRQSEVSVPSSGLPRSPWPCWWPVVLPHPPLQPFPPLLWIFLFYPRLSRSFTAGPPEQMSTGHLGFP